MKKAFLPLLLFSLLALVGHVSATIIATDGYEAPTYTSGAQIEPTPGAGVNGGSGFTNQNVDDTRLADVTVGNVGLSYSAGSLSIDGGVQSLLVTNASTSNNLVARGFAAQSGTVYLSFLIRTGSATTLDNEDFFQLGLSNVATGEPEMSIGVAGVTAGGLPERFFARSNAGGTSVFSPVDTAFALDTTYLMVAKISKTGGGNYDKVELYVNPTSSTEPGSATATGTADSGVSTLNNFILRSARTDAGDAMRFDNISVGTTFADVVTVPEPGVVSLVGVGLLLLGARRSRDPEFR